MFLDPTCGTHRPQPTSSSCASYPRSPSPSSLALPLAPQAQAQSVQGCSARVGGSPPLALRVRPPAALLTKHPRPWTLAASSLLHHHPGTTSSYSPLLPALLSRPLLLSSSLLSSPPCPPHPRPPLHRPLLTLIHSLRVDIARCPKSGIHFSGPLALHDRLSAGSPPSLAFFPRALSS